MITTDITICRKAAAILAAHGVERVVVSPGSRNAPLITAVNAVDGLKVDVVVDERSAAFVGLGIAAATRRPVALVCTSGTALYNYAPALAEAFYRQIPLIAISADRPAEWIGQADSQTLLQPGALDRIVKRSFAIPVVSRPGDLWSGERQINEAVALAAEASAGPVHINIALDEPLWPLADLDEPELTEAMNITTVAPPRDLPTAGYRSLAASLASPRKVMVVAGFLPPDATLRKAIARLASLPNVAVLAENVSNLWGTPGVVEPVDAAVASLAEAERGAFAPDVVISIGGALISRRLKTFLRETHPAEVWHVGPSHGLVDCFRGLTRHFEIEPRLFMRGIASGLQIHRRPCGYGALWQTRARAVAAVVGQAASEAPWSDLSAFHFIARNMPAKWNLVVSNGMAVRYTQLFPAMQAHMTDCNRGVSGIDGSTSTALGVSTAYGRDATLLITGDLSATYDIGALTAVSLLTPRLKIVVIDNGGGGIFRTIPSTRSMPDLERCIEARQSIPFAAIAAPLGFAAFEAASSADLEEAWPDFAAESRRPAILVVHTDSPTSADVFASLMTRINKTDYNKISTQL